MSTKKCKIYMNKFNKESAEAIQNNFKVLNISAKKQRKTIEQERLEISSRKLEIQREHFM